LSDRSDGYERVRMSLEVDVEDLADHTIVLVRGEVDLATSPALRERLVEITEGETPRVVVDLEEVSFIDSTGIGVLVGGIKRARSQGGELSLVCTQRRILKVLEVTGLTRVFQVHERVADAIGSGVGGEV
jgi:anti-sigma B factor antagonist